MLRFLVLIVIAAPAWACSCGGYPSAKEAWIETPLVFAGIVEKVDPKSLERSMTGEQSAFVRVTETFKGAKKDQVIELRDRLSSCFLGFQEGAVELFYVYPGEKQGTWIAPPCHRTRRMDDAADDLRFLRGLPNSARGNRVSGVIHLYENDPARGFRKVRDIAGARVRAVNAEGGYDTVTDAQGLYEFRDLRPGTYKIEIDVPKGMKLYFPIAFGRIKQQQRRRMSTMREDTVLEVTEDSGNGFDFHLSPDTKITGRVLDPDGKPMKGVCVEIEPLQGSAEQRSTISNCTKADGTYVLERVPEGSHRVVANRRGGMSAAAPFGRLYHPGEAEAAQARVLTVVAGQSLDGIDFQVPKLAARIELRGRLTFSDGVPLPNQSVNFRGEDGYREHALTDADGNFLLKILGGRLGQLTGQIMVWREKDAACPQFQVKVDHSGTMAILESTPFPVAGDRSLSSVELVFAVPSCAAWLKKEAELRLRLKP